jgi:phosphotransacetylase
VIDDELKGRFREIVVKEHKDGEAIMKTIADSYREEGRKEKERELKKVIEQKDTALKQRDAEIEHKEEFVNQIVKRMTQKGMSLQSIQDITGLDNETIEKIIKKT